MGRVPVLDRYEDALQCNAAQTWAQMPGAGNDCQDCANVDGDGARVMRGGDWQYNAPSLRGAERFPGSAGADWLGAGIRCARD